MDDKLNIKHLPEPRRMITEYGMMFKGFSLKIQLVYLAIVGVTLLIFVYGPSISAPEISIHNLMVGINAFFLFGSGAFLCYLWVSPFLARLILPLLIIILDLVRILMLYLQSVIDEILINHITEGDLYPKARAD